MKPITFIAIFLGVMILYNFICRNCNDKELYYKKSHIHFWVECIDGKEFIVSYRHLSINLNHDGKPIHCEENE